MKILIAVDKIVRGAGNAAQQLAIMLSKKHDVVLFFDSIDGASKFDLSGITVVNRGLVPIHLNNPFATLFRKIKTNRNVKKQILEIKPDLIISLPNSTSVPLLEAIMLTKIPIIVSERSNPFVEWEENGIVANFRWWFSYLRASAIVYQFSCFKSFMTYANLCGNAYAIPNMVFAPYKRYHQNGKNNIIKLVSLAGLQPIKRLDLMIRCFVRLKKNYPNIQLFIYGEGQLREELEREVIEFNLQDSIFLPGNILNTYEKLSECDIFVLTSKREGFPNSMVEAMAVGVVPVSFEFHEGMSEIIKDNENGFLVNNGDEDQLVEKIGLLIENPEMLNRLKTEAMMITKKYNPEIVLEQWNYVIDKVTKHSI